jgi:hypothetical protein
VSVVNLTKEKEMLCYIDVNGEAICLYSIGQRGHVGQVVMLVGPPVDGIEVVRKVCTIDECVAIDADYGSYVLNDASGKIHVRDPGWHSLYDAEQYLAWEQLVHDDGVLRLRDARGNIPVSDQQTA